MTTSTVSQRIKCGLLLIISGQFSDFVDEFRKRIYSTTHSFGLSRNINEPFTPPKAKIPITIRPIRPDDFDKLMQSGNLKETEPDLYSYQLNCIKAEIPQCYVAVDENDNPSYIQWLVDHTQNELIQKHFGTFFPLLKPGEALLEAAFMSHNYRGLGIMPEAMARIAEKAQLSGAEKVITFVTIDNISSLKGCHRAGFSPYILRTERWRFFRRSITDIASIPDSFLSVYERQTSSKKAT